MKAILRVAAFSMLLVLLIVAGMRLGHSADGRGNEVLPGPLRALAASGAELAPLGRTGALDGWLVRRADGSVLTVYALADGHVVVGLLYGPDGLEVTGAQLERAARKRAEAEKAEKERQAGSGPGPGVPDLAAAVRAAAAAASSAQPRAEPQGFEVALERAAFSLGQAGRDVALFADPGCPWSRQAAASLGSLALDGAFRLHVLPVGVMGPEAYAQAAGILSAARPGLVWFGGEPGPATPEGRTGVDANNALWRSFGAKDVPFLVWRGADGAIRTHAGLPSSSDFLDAGAAR